MQTRRTSGRPLGHAEVTLLGLEQARRDFKRRASSPGSLRTAVRRVRAVLFADDRPLRTEPFSPLQAPSRGR